MKIRLNKDGTADIYKATFYEDEISAIAQCLNFVLSLVAEQQDAGVQPFVPDNELGIIVDVANRCNQLISQLPKETK